MEDIASSLLPGERLLWSGHPARGILFTPSDIILIPFSLFWAGFAIFWETAAVLSHAPRFFWFWGVPFVAGGLYIVAGRFFIDAYARNRTTYALTNRRILIARAGPFKNVIAVALDRLPQASLTESPSGRGTIRFGDAAPSWSRRSGVWMPALDSIPQFLAIDDVRDVFEQIQRLAQQRESVLGAAV